MAEQAQEGGGGPPATAAAPAPVPARARAPALLGLRQADQAGVARSRKRRGGISPLWTAVAALPPTDAPNTHKCVHCDENLVLSRNQEWFLGHHWCQFFITTERETVDLQGFRAAKAARKPRVESLSQRSSLTRSFEPTQSL